MSHVDEGTLHAYLDGELSSSERAALERHLETCTTCRGLLSDERALLERASALLGSARPVERPAPPFEQVRRTPKRSGWRVRTSLAWAASIVLAVGLGYYFGTGAGKVDAPSALALRTPATVVTDSTSTVAIMPADKAAESVRRSRSEHAQQPPPDLANGRDAVVIADGARVDSAPAGLVAQPPAMRLRGASPAAQPREADSLAVAQRSAEANNGVLMAPAASGVVSFQARGDSAKVNAAPAPARPDSRSVRNLVSTTWPLISKGTAASMLGERPVGVPGLATRRIRRSPGPDSTVVVEQALDSTTVIQIFQRPATDERAAERERADRVLARYVGRLRVEISGPVSTDSLNKLLEQVEPLP